MKHIVTVSIIGLTLLPGCTNGKAQRKTETDAINVEYRQLSDARIAEFQSKLDAAEQGDKQAIFDWHMDEQSRLARDRQEKIDEVFARWRGDTPN